MNDSPSKMFVLFYHVNDCALTQPQFVCLCVEAAPTLMAAAVGSRARVRGGKGANIVTAIQGADGRGPRFALCVLEELRPVKVVMGGHAPYSDWRLEKAPASEQTARR